MFNATATTLNVGQAATAVSIGATTGTATIRNGTTAISGAATVGQTLAVTGNTTLTGNLAVNGGDITTSSATASVFDTTATTLNIGGAATTLNVADDVTAAQTINIGTGATGTGATKTINIGTGGAAGSTTNINLGDADGGTVVVNRALTVNGLTTLSGGLAGTVDYSNLPVGTPVNFQVVSTSAQSASGTEGPPFTTGITTATHTITFTKRLASSTVYLRPSKNVGEVKTLFTNPAASLSFSFGNCTWTNVSGASLTASGSLPATTLTLDGSGYLVHTGTATGSVNVTITGTVQVVDTGTADTRQVNFFANWWHVMEVKT